MPPLKRPKYVKPWFDEVELPEENTRYEFHSPDEIDTYTELPFQLRSTIRKLWEDYLEKMPELTIDTVSYTPAYSTSDYNEYYAYPPTLAYHGYLPMTAAEKAREIEREKKSREANKRNREAAAKRKEKEEAKQRERELKQLERLKKKYEQDG